MKTYQGIVTKIKIIRFDSQPLVYFRIDQQDFLIAHHSLNFLADVSIDSHIAVAFTTNKKHQRIVRKYGVIGQTQLMQDFKNLSYSGV
ncbi:MULTISPECIES: hypothetical protein [Enterococcus]|uniref:Uncharacterized protein n=1 Tax=Enterococcus alishanensis TaxID=1303817 RepID=A0ABS6TD02_9ENTE|nr:hypothetical protein [Enterococcus alishanensis]MBV7390814.1 hypothetical protein [Enterococcus alishanensis]